MGSICLVREKLLIFISLDDDFALICKWKFYKYFMYKMFLRSNLKFQNKNFLIYVIIAQLYGKNNKIKLKSFSENKNSLL